MIQVNINEEEWYQWQDAVRQLYALGYVYRKSAREWRPTR